MTAHARPAAGRRYAFDGLPGTVRLIRLITYLSLGAAGAPVLFLVFSGALAGAAATFTAAVFAFSALTTELLLRWGFPPDSFVAVESGGLRVRLGGLFDREIPFANIASAAPSEHSLLGGIGLRVGLGGKVAVVTSTRNIVALRLREPMPVRILPGWWTNAREIRLSIADSAVFLDELRPRLRP